MTSTPGCAQYPSLKNYFVVITGGASGIGAVLVAEFARQGSRVAFLDIAREAATSLTATLSPEAVHAPLFRCCDLTDIAGLRSAIAELEVQFGPVGVLVNNAANDDRHMWSEVTPEYWDQCMNLNLRHNFFAIQAV